MNNRCWKIVEPSGIQSFQFSDGLKDWCCEKLRRLSHLVTFDASLLDNKNRPDKLWHAELLETRFNHSFTLIFNLYITNDI